MGKYIDGSGLSHFMGIIKGWAVPNTRKVNGHALSADVTVSKSDVGLGNVTNTEQAPKAHASTATTYGAGTSSNYGHVKLSDAINGTAAAASGGTAATPKAVADALAAVRSFKIFKVGSTNVEADSNADTLELAGSNVTLTPDATNDKVTIGITASNVTTALGNTAVARATGDASGNSISGTYAPKASPALTGTPTAPTATAGTNTTQIATTAFVQSAVTTATAGALNYMGTVDAESTITGAAYKKGWYYIVTTAGTYAGKVCEVGDMLIAKQDKTSTPANDWDAVQTNIEILSNSEIDALWAAA